MKGKIKLMKNRSRLTIFATILPALACFGLLSGAQAQEGDLGGGNTNEGFGALGSLSGGGFNTGLGWYAVGFLTDAAFDTGVGAGGLVFDTGGTNKACGTGALLPNSTGSQNNAFGDLAMESNTTGSFNTAMGDDALIECTTGSSNVAIGDEAGTNLVDGEGNIYIGAQVNTGGSSEVEFIRIGNDSAFSFPYDTYIAGIFSRAVDGGSAAFVFVDDTGKLGTVLVDRAGNKMATPQAMLNESRNQQKRIAELEGTVERLTAMVKEQGAQIQKVSAQLEVSKPAPQVVVNKP